MNKKAFEAITAEDCAGVCLTTMDDWNKTAPEEDRCIQGFNFDYLFGRPIKVSICVFPDGTARMERAKFYDRDSFKTAQSIVDEMRSEKEK